MFTLQLTKLISPPFTGLNRKEKRVFKVRKIPAVILTKRNRRSVKNKALGSLISYSVIKE